MSYHYLFPSVMRMNVEFSSPSSVYEPGGEVSGLVVFECDRPLPVSCLEFCDKNFSGKNYYCNC